MYQIESVYQIEEKGMKTRNHGFSRLLIQVNKRYKKGFFTVDTAVFDDYIYTMKEK